MKFVEILKKNRELANVMGEVKKHKVAIISNIVTHQIKDILELELRLHGVNVEVVFGDYDNIVQDSKKLADCKVIIVFWEACNFVDGLYYKVEEMGMKEIDLLVDRVEGEMSLVLKNLSSSSCVLMNSFSSLLFDANDALVNSKLKQMCNRLNSILYKNGNLQVEVVNLDRLIATLGVERSVDDRQFKLSKSLYSLEFCKKYVDCIAPLLLGKVFGKVKKLIVLDCDNTLWHGVLGEVGELGVLVGEGSSQGKFYEEVQVLLKQLKNKGVLLALCSKNNLEDVQAVLENHTGMVLKSEDFVSMKVNWKNKANNIKEMAFDLNIGLDSIVFFDDSDFEIGLVQTELPMVKCIHVPKNISAYPRLVRNASRLFLCDAVTDEDVKRSRMYSDERKRKTASNEFLSIEGYLSSLNLSMSYFFDDLSLVDRAVQLSQKTNQFNLTSHRYSLTDIQKMLNSSSFTVCLFSLADKYGDYGVTGMSIIEYEDSGLTARIDTLLMSCRVIGRNVEFSFMDKLVFFLNEKGVELIKSEYVKSNKNSQVESFYSFIGFAETISSNSRIEYIINIKDYVYQSIEYIKEIS